VTFLSVIYTQKSHKPFSGKSAVGWLLVVRQAGPLKGYLRVAHGYLDSAFWVAYGEFKQSAKRASL
jgi:hypothetical protein